MYELWGSCQRWVFVYGGQRFWFVFLLFRWSYNKKNILKNQHVESINLFLEIPYYTLVFQMKPVEVVGFPYISAVLESGSVCSQNCPSFNVIFFDFDCWGASKPTCLLLISSRLTFSEKICVHSYSRESPLWLSSIFY